jgi:dihydroxyacetone kinase phosphotransfer subunit
MSDRVGLVVVSHSADLAEAAVALASEMVAEEPAPIAVAAGADDGGFGTDATAVMAAIEEVASPAGVLVLMDLGSAVLSTEMALEFLGEADHPVRLSAAPLVEGLVAAVVQASLGSDLDVVAREADAALAAKADQLADVDGVTSLPDDPSGGPGDDVAHDQADASAEVELVNDTGLHARPASRFAAVAAAADARVRVANTATDSDPVDGAVMARLIQLKARQGHVLAITASGDGADQAVEDLVALVASGFDEDGSDDG